MKILNYKVAGFLQQDETGPPAQVGDQVKMFLDQQANPELPEFVFGIIQPGIRKAGCCDDYTVYKIGYDLEEFTLRPDDIINLTTTAAVDVVANDLLEHIENVGNPHEVTKAQVGLGNVDNTSDLNKPISTATQTALNLKAPLASPAFTGNPTAPTPATADNDTSVATTAYVKAQLDSTALTGTPTAPTAAPGTSTTQLATTAFVTTADNLKAPLASPTFTGDPKAPTPSTSDNDTSIATTAYVKAQLASTPLTGTPTVNGNTVATRVSPPSSYGDSGSNGQYSSDATYFYYYADTRWERIEKDATWV